MAPRRRASRCSCCSLSDTGTSLPRWSPAGLGAAVAASCTWSGAYLRCHITSLSHIEELSDLSELSPLTPGPNRAPTPAQPVSILPSLSRSRSEHRFRSGRCWRQLSSLSSSVHPQVERALQPKKAALPTAAALFRGGGTERCWQRMDEHSETCLLCFAPRSPAADPSPDTEKTWRRERDVAWRTKAVLRLF